MTMKKVTVLEMTLQIMESAIEHGDWEPNEMRDPEFPMMALKMLIEQEGSDSKHLLH